MPFCFYIAGSGYIVFKLYNAQHKNVFNTKFDNIEQCENFLKKFNKKDFNIISFKKGKSYSGFYLNKKFPFSLQTSTTISHSSEINYLFQIKIPLYCELTTIKNAIKTTLNIKDF